MLIGICGLIGSGKDTVAERLVNEHGYKRDSFAKSLKDAVASMFNWDRDMLEGRGESSRHWREQPDKFWSERFGREVSPRTILQQFGTEVMRGQMYDGIWLDSCMGRYRGQNTVIADTRFPNEIKTIKAHGGKIILVKRGQDPDWFTSYVEGNIIPTGIHSSEYLWAKSEFDFTINNDGTKEELYKKIDDLIIGLQVTNTPTKPTNTAEPLTISTNRFKI